MRSDLNQWPQMPLRVHFTCWPIDLYNVKLLSCIGRSNNNNIKVTLMLLMAGRFIDNSKEKRGVWIVLAFLSMSLFCGPVQLSHSTMTQPT